ncbi:hypothetical protein GQ55_7G087900 [Panicum hallii var. hallii]|uniref:Uncharacterized protein n=1 Tax=Panicum hallii var. hallii TaxID=1504633 RepID=A0A2T7CT81_9POAL|nr:hypothetical protein GQ55_7G087900 [Panicum hallii var. hallii]
MGRPICPSSPPRNALALPSSDVLHLALPRRPPPRLPPTPSSSAGAPPPLRLLLRRDAGALPLFSDSSAQILRRHQPRPLLHCTARAQKALADRAGRVHPRRPPPPTPPPSSAATNHRPPLLSPSTSPSPDALHLALPSDRRVRRGTHRSMPRADGPAGGFPGRVLAVLPQRRHAYDRAVDRLPPPAAPMIHDACGGLVPEGSQRV